MNGVNTLYENLVRFEQARAAKLRGGKPGQLIRPDVYKRNQACPCGSGEKIKNCHKDLLRMQHGI